MFINPMWDNEAQRIGLKRCTPFGYFVYGISDLVGLIGLVVFLGTPIFAVYQLIIGSFTWGTLWLSGFAVILGVVRLVLSAITWSLAKRHDFSYDDETRVASWKNNGEIRTLHYSDLSE